MATVSPADSPGRNPVDGEIESVPVDPEAWMDITNSNYDMDIFESTVFDSTLDPHSDNYINKNPMPTRGSMQPDIDWKTSFDPEELIICPFVWGHGGDEAYLLSNFGDGPRKFKMHKSGNKFYLILDIKRGIYPYLFIIDGEKCYSTEQPNFATKTNRVVNIVDIRYYVSMDYSLKNDSKWASTLNYTQKLPRESYFNLCPTALPDIFNYSPIGEDFGFISNDIHVYGNNLCRDNKASELLGDRYDCYAMIIREDQESIGSISHRQLYTEYLYVKVAEGRENDSMEGDRDVALWRQLVDKRSNETESGNN